MREALRASAVVTDPRGTTRAPVLAAFPALLSETRRIERRGRLRSRNRLRPGGLPSPRLPLLSRSFEPLRTRARATLAISPDETEPDTFVTAG